MAWALSLLTQSNVLNTDYFTLCNVSAFLRIIFSSGKTANHGIKNSTKSFCCRILASLKITLSITNYDRFGNTTPVLPINLISMTSLILPRMQSYASFSLFYFTNEAHLSQITLSSESVVGDVALPAGGKFVAFAGRRYCLTLLLLFIPDYTNNCLKLVF